MNLDNNTIIKGDIRYGFKFLEGFNKYEVVLMDDFANLLKYKKEIKNILDENSKLIIYTEKEVDCNNINYFNMKLIDKKQIDDKFLYLYGTEKVLNIYNKSIERLDFNNITITIDNKCKRDNLNLFSKNNILNYNISRFLNKTIIGNSKTNILDISCGEELPISVITNDNYKTTILGNDKRKLRITCSVNGVKLNLVELI